MTSHLKIISMTAKTRKFSRKMKAKGNKDVSLRCRFGTFRDNFKRFMSEHIAPHYEKWEREGIMPRSVWTLLGENGFLCVDVPEEYGGYGVPTHYSLMLVEESARAGYCALSTGISCHSEKIAAPYIQHIGSEEQKQYWLPKMVSGEVVGAIGMTEPWCWFRLAGHAYQCNFAR